MNKHLNITQNWLQGSKQSNIVNDPDISFDKTNVKRQSYCETRTLEIDITNNRATKVKIGIINNVRFVSEEIK